MYFLDLIGTLAFAIAGAYKAREKNLNIYAVVLAGLVTAVGGGTFRDLVIGRMPLFYLRDANYLVLVLIGGIATYFIPHFFKKGFSFFRFLDSLGLAAFTIIGISVTFDFLYLGVYQGIVTAIVCILMGTLTGVGGGIIRNAMLSNLPTIFNQESTYIPAAFLGSAAFYFLMFWHTGLAIAASLFITLAMRELVAEHGLYRRTFKENVIHNS